jgi:hypothetical protein
MTCHLLAQLARILDHALVERGSKVACQRSATLIFLVVVLFEILIVFGSETPVQRHGTIASFDLRQENRS